MLNRMLLGVVAFTISSAAVAAKDEAKKEECPALGLNAIEILLRQAPSCQRAAILVGPNNTRQRIIACQIDAAERLAFGA